MIGYIGDISQADAHLLARYARHATRILEFGIGGSTQVIAWAANAKTEINCVETDPKWVEQTRRNFRKVGLREDRVSYFDIHDTPGGSYDFVFVDGVDDKRLPFALMAWQLLSDEGIMAFHDTRRVNDLNNALKVPLAYPGSVREILINECDSNITVLVKRDPPLLYENWNTVEGKVPAGLDADLI